MKYIVNKNPQKHTEYHIIHKINCKKRPREENSIDLKECICVMEAKSRAKEYYANVNGCQYCCKEISYKKEKDI